MGFSCNPPRSDPPPPDRRWMCPDCGQVFELTVANHGYDFSLAQGIVTGSWVPTRDASDTQHGEFEVVVEVATIDGLEGREREKEVARQLGDRGPEFKGWIWRQVTASASPKDGKQAFKVEIAPRRR